MSSNILTKLALSFLMASPLALNAAVELPDVISDNAVLQQNTDAKLWGWAKPGSTVTVTTSWNDAKYTAAADKNSGKWEVKVSTPAASFTPYTFK